MIFAVGQNAKRAVSRMDEYIKRKDALIAICKACYSTDDEDYTSCECYQNEKDTFCDYKNFLAKVPSADVISRTAFDKIKSAFSQIRWERDTAIRQLDHLPSAQPTQIGWICPVCGRGLSPFTTVCHCQNGKGWEITCKT